jgi:uncharacterized membrane protein YbhN (UPF0104 family)
MRDGLLLGFGACVMILLSRPKAQKGDATRETEGYGETSVPCSAPARARALQSQGAQQRDPLRTTVRRLLTRLTPRRRRVLAGGIFAVITTAAAVLLGQKLTHTSWPLAHARTMLVADAAVCYFASFVLRARGWHRLFPPEQQPGQGRCLASVGAAAASGVVLPFRLDYMVKIGTLRRLGGIRIGLEAIALSIVSLGMIDAVAMLPLSISATATSSAGFRGPLLLVVAFGVACLTLLVASTQLIRLPLLRRSRRLHSAANHISAHKTQRGRRSALVAGFYLFGCWTTRAVGSALLLSALGFRFSPTTALVVLCLSAAAGVIPITAGGAIANVGATAAILLALGVDRDLAINFSLASGLLLVVCASAAAVSGVVVSVATRALAARRPLLHHT